MPTTNARIRDHFEGDNASDGDPYTATDAPANAANTVVAENTRLHVVTADGTNTVDLSNAAREGHALTVVHNGGANTPAVAFTDADFVGTGPANLTAAGATATVKNVDGTATGWVVVGTGSA